MQKHTEMNKLTLQDYIDLEKLIKTGAEACEQQALLLSRYYELNIDTVKNMDIRLANIMVEHMNKNIQKNDITPEEINDEIKKIREDIEDDNNIIENRFGILDL